MKSLPGKAKEGIARMLLGASVMKRVNDRSDLASRICQMREAGVSMDETISTHGDSWEEWGIIRRIVRKFETEAVLVARSNRFMAEIRSADDLDRKWRASYLMQALRPRPLTQTAISRHFEWGHCREISLRELMDLTISERSHPKPGYLIAGILRVRCVGIDGFWSLVRRLADSDLGERCNLEWSSRLLRLLQCSRIVDGQGGWSKPCDLPDWLLKESAGA